MKLIICMLIMLISAKECDNNKAEIDSQTKTESNLSANMSQKQAQDDKVLNYRAATRGFYLEIWIEGDTIKYTSDYNLKDIHTHQIPTEEKEALMDLVNQFDEKQLPTIESPSKKHQYDGAPIATLKITIGDETYKSLGFDHGNPPKLIYPIVEKMLSIKTMIEKQ
nr:hypothetical protein [uncultured Psychroserpens sp.]